MITHVFSSVKTSTLFRQGWPRMKNKPMTRRMVIGV